MQLKSVVCAVAAVAVLSVLAVGSSALGAVSTGHSGWEWGNPLPQGNEIRALEFAGNRGYAAGKFGTLLSSSDGGATWAGNPTGITQDLTRVRIIDADSLVIAGGCAVRRSDNSGGSFTRLAWTASDSNCPHPVVAVAFPSDQVGYLLLSSGDVFRTADGGRSWARKTAVPGGAATGGTAAPTDLSLTGPDAGVASTAAGRIYRTTDGGSSWTLVETHTNGLLGLSFVDALTGYAVGSASSVLKTVDGGTNWTVNSSGGSLVLNSIRCATADACLVTTDTGDRLLRTIDGGDSFSSVTPSTEKIFTAAFASATRAIAAGSFGATVVSSDAGATWTPVGGRIAETFTRLRAASASIAVAVGQRGTLARTTDGGHSWAALGVSTAQELVDASFPTAGSGYALDSAGSVLRTDNGGSSWQILNTGSSARPLAILAPAANRVLLIGPRGLLRSTNAGESFKRVRGRAARARVTDVDRAGGSLFAWGSTTLISSRNGGKTWKQLRRPARAGLAAVDFVSSRTAFALTIDGRVWQTRNAGRRWRELSATGSSDAIDLSFGSARAGWLVLRRFAGGSGGHLLRTSDGGRTWTPQQVDDDLTDRDGIAATGRSTGFLLSGTNNLLFTTTGGELGSPTNLTLKTKKRRLAKRATIKVSGRLSPAEGGEQVVVSMRKGGSTRWSHSVATVASNGSFTTSWKVSRSSQFVAQWSGDDDRAGDGSKPLSVTVGRGR